MILTYDGIEKREYLRMDFEVQLDFELCSNNEVAQSAA